MLLSASLLALLLARLAFLEGWWRPIRVASGSMAPNLPGPHYEQICSDCQLTWRFDSVATVDLRRIVCPNCGYRPNQEIPHHSLHPGHRLLVDRWPVRSGSLRRGDLVVFHMPDEPQTLAVKRLVGLPAEQISIFEGDLYADGHVVRKSLEQFRSQAILVHDDRFPPRKTSLPARWQPEEEEPEWLSFRAWRCFDNPLPRSEETYILDNDSYNQGNSRQLQRVFDLLLTGEVDFRQAEQLEIRGHNGLAWYRLHADHPKRQLTLWRDEQLVHETTGQRSGPSWNGRWEFALVDRQVLVGIAGTEVLRYVEPAGPPGENHHDSSREARLRPLAVRQAPAYAALEERRVHRDIHNFHPHGNDQLWKGPELGTDEYLVLGDNVPISRDGRWGERPLSRKYLYGKVIRTWGR
jgi:signal peptidase I